MQRLSAAMLGDLLAGDLRVFGGPSTIEPLAGRIRAEPVNIVLRNTLLAMLANILNAATVVLAVWGSPDQTKAILWASVIIGAAGFVGLRARILSVSQTKVGVSPDYAKPGAQRLPVRHLVGRTSRSVLRWGNKCRPGRVAT